MTLDRSQLKNAPWKSYTARIRRIVAEAPKVNTYEFEFVDQDFGAQFEFAPGQFNMLYVPGVGEAAISISSDPASPSKLLHTIRSVGAVTEAIEASGVGSTLGLRGPFGSCWPVQECVDGNYRGFDVIVVAGGIGLAPLRPVIYSIINHRECSDKVTVLVGARTPNDLLFQHEYDVWSTEKIEVQTTIDRASADWQGNIGVVTTLLTRLSIPNPNRTLVLACGPEVMMRYVVQTAMSRKILAENIWVSLERNMNCAVGLCGHCQMGPEFLCKDGPVFRYPRVAEWLKVQAF